MFKHVMGTLALAALIGTVQGQEYTLKFKSYPDKGQTFIVKENDKGTEDVTFEVGGQTVPQSKKTSKEVEYEWKVVKAGDPRPDEFTRTYTKANTSTDNKVTKLPYSGRTVVFSLNKDQYKVTAEGEPSLTDKSLEDLIKQGKDPSDSLEGLLDPGKAVKVNDTWTPDKKKLLQAFGKDELGTVDSDKSKSTAKLLKVYKKDNQQWGSIELNIEIVITKLGGPGAAIKLTEPALLKMVLTIDRPIDGSSATMLGKGTVNAAIKGTVEQNNMTINVDLKSNGELDRSMTEKK